MVSAAEKYLNKAQCTINRAARIVTGNFEYGVSGLELLKQIGLMHLKERRDYLMSVLVLSVLTGPPHFICAMF